MSEPIDIAVDLGVVAPPLPEIEFLRAFVETAPDPPPQIVGGILQDGFGRDQKEQQILVLARSGGECRACPNSSPLNPQQQTRSSTTGGRSNERSVLRVRDSECSLQTCPLKSETRQVLYFLMRKHRTILSVLVAVGLCGLITFGILRSNEPAYGGHTLSYWLDRHHQVAKAGRPDSSQSEACRKAVMAIGTNAIPWLLQWIRYEPNPIPTSVLNRVQWSFWSTRLGGVIMFGTGQGNSRAEATVWAFGVLGTNAAPAINDLVLMMHDGSHPMTSTRATMALGGLGQCAFDPLAQALGNPKQRERQLIALELFEMRHDPAVGTNKVLPFVTMAANDSDPQLRTYASNVLASVAFAAPTNSSGQ